MAALVLSCNIATDNLNIGLSIARCPPFQTVADVTANANSASGNGQGQIVVGDESGGNQYDDRRPDDDLIDAHLHDDAALDDHHVVPPGAPGPAEVLRPDCAGFRGKLATSTSSDHRGGIRRRSPTERVHAAWS
jgi:hypothetical protein